MEKYGRKRNKIGREEEKKKDDDDNWEFRCFTSRQGECQAMSSIHVTLLTTRIEIITSSIYVHILSNSEKFYFSTKDVIKIKLSSENKT